MSLSLKPLDRQTIVVTGASSGIGLATALLAAADGARVVLASRNADALAKIVEKIEGQGGAAVAAPADVGRRADVQRIHDVAIERFGGFDTWVNNAGVDVWGRMDEVSEEDNRRLFETNFWGVVNGSLIAVAHLKGKGGALINVGSLASDRAFPLQGMYSASKHAVKGFTDALRMEMEEAKAGISVTLVKPAAIGTPLTLQAKNYLDHEPRLPSPLYAPEEVALAILHAAVQPKRDIHVGGVSKAISMFGSAAPRLMDLYSEMSLFDVQKQSKIAQPRIDNLHQAGPQGCRIRADPENRTMRKSAYTRVTLSPANAVLVVALSGLALGAIGRLGWKRPR